FKLLNVILHGFHIQVTLELTLTFYLLDGSPDLLLFFLVFFQVQVGHLVIFFCQPFTIGANDIKGIIIMEAVTAGLANRTKVEAIFPAVIVSFLDLIPGQSIRVVFFSQFRVLKKIRQRYIGRYATQLSGTSIDTIEFLECELYGADITIRIEEA